MTRTAALQLDTDPEPERSRSSRSTSHTNRPSLGRAVRTLSGLTLVSRLAGLVRDLVTARIFGDTAVGSAFAAAFAIPNLFRRLFGEGALSAAFLPEYARLEDTDRPAAGAFAGRTLVMLAVVTGGLTVVIELALLLTLMFAPADHERDFSLRLIMAMLPFMPLICTAAILGGMLQASGRFAPWAAAPLVLNGCILAAAVPYIGDNAPHEAAYVIAGAVVLSGVLQVVLSIAALRGRVAWTLDLRPARDRTRAMLIRLVPVLIGLGTLQLNAMIDTLIAMWPNWFGPTIAGKLYPLDTASNAVLFFAQRLYQFPLGVFGIAIATAVFPMLSRDSAADDPVRAARFTDTLQRGVLLSLLVCAPASAGLIIVAPNLTATLYGGDALGGGFTGEGIERAAAVLTGYGFAIWAYAINQVLTRAFYARGDTRTPVHIALRVVVVNLVLNLLLIWPLREAGLAWATAIAAMLQTVLLARAARRSLGIESLLGSDGQAAVARVVMTTAAMAIAVLLAENALNLPAWPMRTWADHAIALGVAVVAGGGVYTLLAMLTAAEEMGWLFGREHHQSTTDGNKP